MISQTTTLLLRLLIAHLIADFPLQSEKAIAQRRQRKWKSGWLYIHASLYALLLLLFSLQWQQFYWLFPILFISHLIIDGIKSHAHDTLMYFIFDQLAHISVLVILCIILQPLDNTQFISIRNFITTVLNSQQILSITIGYLLILWPSGYLLSYILKLFQAELTHQQNRGLVNAGLWIGYLERFLVYSFMITGHIQAIGFLLTAKSIFRFGEVKDPQNRKEAEYILIGTFLSFALTMTIGYIITRVTAGFI
jgi:Protein of unknown function (DUF3307)